MSEMRSVEGLSGQSFSPDAGGAHQPALRCA